MTFIDLSDRIAEMVGPKDGKSFATIKVLQSVAFSNFSCAVVEFRGAISMA